MIDKNMIMEKFTKVEASNMSLMSPFHVCKKRKTAFLHIAKTGGSSIVKILRDNGFDDRVLSNKEQNWDVKRLYFKDFVDNWDDYYKFTFIRNKYSLLVSLWLHGIKSFKVNFEQFIKEIVVPNKDIYGYWLDQYYLTIIDNKQIFDFVGRQENFQEDIKIPFAKIGIKKYNSKKIVNNGRRNIKKYYSSHCDNVHYTTHYTDELKSLVDKKFNKK